MPGPACPLCTWVCFFQLSQHVCALEGNRWQIITGLGCARLSGYAALLERCQGSRHTKSLSFPRAEGMVLGFISLDPHFSGFWGSIIWAQKGTLKEKIYLRADFTVEGEQEQGSTPTFCPHHLSGCGRWLFSVAQLLRF